MPTAAVRLLIVDDHAVLRAVLRSVLESGDISVVGEGANGREALQMTALLEPDVVLLDMNMPVMNGIEAAQWLTLQHPQVAVLGLSAGDSVYAETAMRAAGAMGFVAKGAGAPELRVAILHAHEAHKARAASAASTTTESAQLPHQNEDAALKSAASSLVSSVNGCRPPARSGTA
ncbi:MAG TPA: response regulator [Planctomycetaceae bacterium]|nr:response regulator [Planctomycetaceae bacterium]